jgi:hypothetical protein
LVQPPAYSEPQFFDEQPVFDERPVLEQRAVPDERAVFEERPALEQQAVFEDRPAFEDQTAFEERPILFGKHFDDEPLVDEPARLWEPETIRHETIAAASVGMISEVVEPEPIAAAQELDASPFFQSEPSLTAASNAVESVVAPEPALSAEPLEAPAVESSPAFEATTFDEPPVFATEPMLVAAESVVATATLEELAEEEADDSLTVSVEASFEDQEPVIPVAAPWIEFDLSDELGDGNEPVFELEAGDATAMLFDDPAFAAFAAAPAKPSAPIVRPVETDFERRLASYDEPAGEEGDTIAEIFAALSNVDQFIVGNERPLAAPAIAAGEPARHVEFFAPTGLAGYRWPPIEGITAEVVDRREHKHDVTVTAAPLVVAPVAVAAAVTPRVVAAAAPAAITPRTARPASKAETHKADRPEWSELIASLRQDIERLRGANQAPAAVPVAARPTQPAPPLPNPTSTEPAAAKPKARGRKPIQDEWGFFDPEQCGFAALVAKLSEITDNNEETELHAH